MVEMREAMSGLAAAGYSEVGAYRVWHEATKTQYAWVLYVSADGQTMARVNGWQWEYVQPMRRKVGVDLISRLQSGGWWMTSSSARVVMPDGVRGRWKKSAGVGELVESHRESLVGLVNETAVRLDRPAEAFEALHGEVVAMHRGRGSFKASSAVPMVLPGVEVGRSVVADTDGAIDDGDGTAEGWMQQAEVAAVDEEASVADSFAVGVVAEMKRQEAGQGRRAWWSTALVLLISGVAFVLLGSAYWDWRLAVMLVPILLLHEAGHWVAMKGLGYRDLRMFFLPLLGAAVTGTERDARAWKRVVVALAGPVPGMVLAVPVGLVGSYWQVHGVPGWLPGGGAAGGVGVAEWMVELAVLTVVINLFNLLPVLPLDGGWVWHALVFSRNAWLDTVFRVVAIAGLVLGSFAPGARVLLYVAIAMVVGLPVSIGMAKVVDRLRRGRVVVPGAMREEVSDGQRLRIVAELRQQFAKGQTQGTLAKLASRVMDLLRAPRPGWAATAGLLGLHGASVVLGVVGLVVVLVGQSVMLGLPLWWSLGGLGGWGGWGAGVEAEYRYEPGQWAASGDAAAGASAAWPVTAVWPGPAVALDGDEPVDTGLGTVMLTFEDAASASAAYEDLTGGGGGSVAGRSGPGGAAWLGQTVLVSGLTETEAGAMRSGWSGRATVAEQRVGAGRLVMVQLEFVASSPAEAERLVGLINGYVGAPVEAWLRAPWSLEAGELSADERLARETLRTLQEAEMMFDPGLTGDAELEAMYARLDRMGSAGWGAASRRMWDEIEQRERQLWVQALEARRGEAGLHAVVLELMIERAGVGESEALAEQDGEGEELVEVGAAMQSASERLYQRERRLLGRLGRLAGSCR
ncbi:MAG: site-2 protease family protein [Planctomycetota bacterium]